MRSCELRSTAWAGIVASQSVQATRLMRDVVPLTVITLPSCLISLVYFPVPTWPEDLTVTDIREKFAAYLFHKDSRLAGRDNGRAG